LFLGPVSVIVDPTAHVTLVRLRQVQAKFTPKLTNRKGPPITSSYFVLAESLTSADSSPAALFARSIQHVINGFVPHDYYLRVANNAVVNPKSSREYGSALRDFVRVDANPLADLLRVATTTDDLRDRWNGINTFASLGVSTTVHAVGNIATVRRPQIQSISDDLRESVAQALVSELASQVSARAQTATHITGERCQVLETWCDLDLPNPLVGELIEFFSQEPAAGVSECVGNAFTSRRTLQREMTRTGLSITSLRTAVRLSVAGNRLRSNGQSITEIAHQTGFFDSAHFVRAWKQSCGLTPSQYRSIAL
jgi:AraC-like DNA-binding protein